MAAHATTSVSARNSGRTWMVRCLACRVHFEVAAEYNMHPLVIAVENAFRAQHADCVIRGPEFVEEVD